MFLRDENTTGCKLNITVVTHRVNHTISCSGIQFLVNPVSDWINSENE